MQRGRAGGGARAGQLQGLQHLEAPPPCVVAGRLQLSHVLAAAAGCARGSRWEGNSHDLVGGVCSTRPGHQ